MTKFGNQKRSFNASYFNEHDCLEYSIQKYKMMLYIAFCVVTLVPTIMKEYFQKLALEIEKN